MIKASLISNSKNYLNNRIFIKNENQIFFNLLKKKFSNNNIDLSTEDINDPNESRINIYFDIPKQTFSNNSFKILIALESLAVIPENASKKLLSNFDLVFTWNKDLIDFEKIFFLNYSSDLSFIVPGKDFDNRKLICNISSNKFSNHKNELYTQRSFILRKLNDYGVDIYLYGFDWDTIPNNSTIFKVYLRVMKNKYLNKIFRTCIKVLPQSFFYKFKFYEGPTAQKIFTMGDYKFALCFENVYNKNGYVSEKITDCLLSYTIPIYLGYASIFELIPKNIYVDYRRFNNIKHLIEFIKNFSEEDYFEFKRNVDLFLGSSSSKIFNTNHNVDEFIQKFNSKF